MKKNKLTLMQEFNIAVKDSVQYQKGIYDKVNNHKYYYPKEYGERINAFLLKKKVASYETDKGSLMSTSSSARLCTNYFYEQSNKESFAFEKPLRNDVSRAKTKMDAVDGLVFCECKCQEIVYGEKELFRNSYHTNQSSKLFKEFNISNIKSHKNRKGEEDGRLDFSLRDLGINLDGKYYKINFNVKQLICHLIAIANEYKNCDEQKVLKYIIFKPKKELIDASDALKKLYADLDNQFKAIKDSKKIQDFLDEHHISLEMEYVYIDTVIEHFGD